MADIKGTVTLSKADIDAIADAVAAKVSGATPKVETTVAAPPAPPAAPPPPPPPPPAPPKDEGPTIEDVRAELNSFAAIETRQKAVDLMKEVTGAASLAEVPKEKYQALIDKLKGK